MRRVASLLLLCALLGCYVPRNVGTPELTRLNGYDAVQSPTILIVDDRGRTVEVTRRSKLWLTLPGRGDVGGRFSRIEVRDGVFYGTTVTGEQISTALSEIRQAEVTAYSRFWTVVAIVGGFTLYSIPILIFSDGAE